MSATATELTGDPVADTVRGRGRGGGRGRGRGDSTRGRGSVGGRGGGDLGGRSDLGGRGRGVVGRGDLGGRGDSNMRGRGGLGGSGRGESTRRGDFSVRGRGDGGAHVGGDNGGRGRGDSTRGGGNFIRGRGTVGGRGGGDYAGRGETATRGRGGLGGRGRADFTGRGRGGARGGANVESATGRGASSNARRSFPRGRGHPSSHTYRNKREVLDGVQPTPIKTFDRIEDDVNEEDIILGDTTYIASYSWLKSDEPTIVVPGSPRLWLNKPFPYRVAPDRGPTFIDQNAHRMPAFPSLPLFRAVDVMEEGRTAKLDWSSIDLITDRNNLRKLLGWAYPIPGVKNKPTFRIDMELVGEKTLILHRWEERSSVNSEGTGFGDSFERESTTPGPGCEQSTLAGHGRIITYDFSGLKLLVRFEVDACFESDTAVPFTDDQTSSEPMDALTETLGSLDISSDTALRVMRGGVIVPQSDLIKIKTRSSPVDTQALDIQIQLLLGQIPRAYIGMHSQGVFGSVHEELSWPESETARHKVQVGLKKLRRVLQEIIDFALASSKNAKLSLVYKDKVLQVYQRTSDASLLPEDVLIRFQE